MARAGRRPGPTETPGAILGAARDLFATRGYQGTSIRAVAADAGVNPALVHHYFRTKGDLFTAAMDLPLNPAEMVINILNTGPREEFAERFVRAFIRIWRDPETGPRLQALLRSAVATEDGAALVRNLAENVVLARASEALGVPKIRVAVAMSHLIGLMLGATILQIEPLASAEEYQLVELITPPIARYLAP
ncbi:MAG TPA: TetR family transcriptional regulator [Jatrophihabitantaceae bacterium]|nr:TetR family transcriptional regulator [Jatrophihabitantaceae bacterium]